MNDICNGVDETDDPGDLDNNCRATPTVIARINAEDIADDALNNGTGDFTLALFEIQGTGGFTGGGNTGLQPEVADSVNIGGVFNHDFGAPGSITLSVDWYRIEIEQIIRALGRNETIELCYDVPIADFNLASPFCQNVVRDVNQAAINNGNITAVNMAFFNDGVAVQEFSGVDTAFLWNFALSDWFGSVPGDVSVRLAWTHLLYETEDGPNDTVGLIESPEDKIQAGATYSVGPWVFAWETNYLSSMLPDLDPASERHFETGEYVTHDLRIGWDVSESANLYFGSNDVLDEDAPLVLSGIVGNTTGFATDASLYDPIGRTWYAGIRLRY